MRSLLAVVITMGVLIFVGIGVLVWGIATKMDSGAISARPALTLPAGSKVTHMTGDRKSLALYVTGKDGDKIYFIDPAKGLRAVMPVETAAPQK